MGSLFKSSGSSITDPGAMEAWKTAQPYHQTALSGISGIAGQDLTYDGQRVADLNPYQTMSANQAGNFVNQTGDVSYGLTGVGLNALSPAAGVGGNFADIYGRASMDPTQSIINAAGQYANNPYVNGLIDASGRDVYRQLNEQQLPSLARAASAGGNTNSTRAGVESAIAQRGANDRMADIASQIRSQFFGTGLNMAQNQYNQNLQNMMGANSGLMNAGQFGAGLIGAGQSYAGNNFNLGQSAGSMYQNQAQNQLTANQQAFNETWQNPLSVYQALSGAAANTQAKTSAGTVTSPSVVSQIGSFIGALK